MVCIRCGTENTEGTPYCSVCGQSLYPQQYADSNKKVKTKQKSRGIALLCAWVGCGLLQWYLGDIVAAKKRLWLLIKSFLLCMVVVGIFFLIYFLILHMIDFFKILFAKNIYDVNGNVVPWRKKKNDK